MTLWPTGIEVARFPLTTVNPVPEIVAAEMFAVAVPVLVSVKLSDVLEPTATLPKLRLVGFGVSIPAPGFVFVVVALV